MIYRIGPLVVALMWCLCASIHAQPILTIERAPDTTRLGCADVATDSIVILNSGDAPLFVGSFTFTGANPGNFASCTNPLPVLQPGERGSLVICISMPTPGVSTAIATIGSNSLGGFSQSPVPIAARRELLSVRLSRDTINFGTLTACGAATDTITIINDGTLVVGAPASSTRNGFLWEPESNANILPGERRTVRITFVGNASGSPYTTMGTFGFSGNGCFVLKEFWMKADVSSAPCLVVRVDSTTALPGDSVNVTIWQDSVAESTDLSGYTMSIEFDYNQTMLVPGFPIPSEFGRQLGVLYVNVPLRKGSGPLLTIPFRATLGSSDRTPLRIRSYSFLPTPLIASIRDGSLSLVGVCTDPRARLFNPAQQRPVFKRIVTTDGRVSVDFFESTMQQTVVIYSLLGDRAAEMQSVSGRATSPPLPPGLYIVQHSLTAATVLVQVTCE
ncbi:hypothetical protein BH10BAC6_BH10BAC6_03810 [soil metagenome]